METRIAEIPGVQDLDYSVVYLSESGVQNQDVCDELEQSFLNNPRFQDAKIKVSYVDDHYLLEGRVRSSLQKQFALVNVVKKVLSTSVENRLRIIEGK